LVSFYILAFNVSSDENKRVLVQTNYNASAACECGVEEQTADHESGWWNNRMAAQHLPLQV